jgi:AcrR family transcriptional regulator
MDRTASQKIIEASLKLFLNKGFKGTTTKMIAHEAGINEVTIFRCFGTKEAIFNEIIKSRRQEMDQFVETFKKTAKYDPMIDLQNIAKLYFDRLTEHINLVMVHLNEFESNQTINEMMLELPVRLKSFLLEYFDELGKRGVMLKSDAEFAAVAFMSTNIGFFLLQHKFGKNLTQMVGYDFIDKSIKAFTDSLIKRE